ncbi:MAG: hypothetical protein KGR69_08545 [Verrucomicrobia bacterium]|nr:hypothetical protein [Verrucomicrobiota bacterium]
MKTETVVAMVLVATGWMGGGVMADDITARVFAEGSLVNRPTKQAIRATFRGNGEFGDLNLDAQLSGTVLSQPGTRLPESDLLGGYPVEVDLRVGKSGISVSDSFGTNVEVFRRRIKISRVGWISLVRPIDPRKSGRQRFRGEGLLRYNF